MLAMRESHVGTFYVAWLARPPPSPPASEAGHHWAAPQCPANELERPCATPIAQLSLSQINPQILMVQSSKHWPQFDTPVALNAPSHGRILP